MTRPEGSGEASGGRGLGEGENVGRCGAPHQVGGRRLGRVERGDGRFEQRPGRRGAEGDLVGVAHALAPIELVGGAFILPGLFTRPVAFILSGEMAVAYFYGHFPHGFWPVLNGGVDAVLYCFLWLYISAAGPGPWSLDARRARS